MCQSSVYTLEKGQEELVLEEVVWVEVDGNRVTLKSLFGEPLSLTARIKTVDLMKHRIILEKGDSD